MYIDSRKRFRSRRRVSLALVVHRRLVVNRKAAEKRNAIPRRSCGDAKFMHGAIINSHENNFAAHNERHARRRPVVTPLLNPSVESEPIKKYRSAASLLAINVPRARND